MPLGAGGSECRRWTAAPVHMVCAALLHSLGASALKMLRPLLGVSPLARAAVETEGLLPALALWASQPAPSRTTGRAAARQCAAEAALRHLVKGDDSTAQLRAVLSEAQCHTLKVAALFAT